MLCYAILIPLPFFPVELLKMSKCTLTLMYLCVQKNKHQELGDDRNLATVRVVAPQVMIGEVWRLVWTIKRPRNPNGRKLLFLAAFCMVG